MAVIEEFLGLFLASNLIDYAEYAILFAAAYNIFRYTFDAIRGFLGNKGK